MPFLLPGLEASAQARVVRRDVGGALGSPVWVVNEPTRARERAPLGSRRARRRGLSKVVSQIEHSAEYRRSLSELHERTSAFQRSLDGSQRELWLELEEALLAHCERYNRAYYHAGFRRGVDWGGRAAAQRSSSAASDAVAAFARLLLELSQR